MRARVVVCILACAGCTGEAPPLDELTLRDALRADPTVVAQLARADRERLAARLEEERERERKSDGVGPSRGDAEDAVRVIDGALEKRGEDSFVVARLDGDHQLAALRAFTLAARADFAAAPLLLDGPPADGTADDETRALAGHAGEVLRALAAATGARRFERVKQWPVAVVAAGEIIYVNASWLVALGPPEESRRSQSLGAGGARPAPRSRAPGFGGLPFDLPDGGFDDGGGAPPDLAAIDLAVPPDLSSTDLAAPPYQPPPHDSCGGSCGACDSCNKSCDNTTTDINKSADSCQKCNDSCAKNKCSVGGGRPAGTLAWLLAPVLYLVARARRRS